MIKTFKELQEVDQLVGRLYREDPTLKDTKFGYAYKRFTDKYYVPVIKEFQDALTYLRIEHALEDEKTKEVLTDPQNQRGFRYSKDGLRAVMEGERKLEEEYEKKEIEVEPWKTQFTPENLSAEDKEQLTGILL